MSNNFTEAECCHCKMPCTVSRGEFDFGYVSDCCGVGFTHTIGNTYADLENGDLDYFREDNTTRRLTNEANALQTISEFLDKQAIMYDMYVVAAKESKDKFNTGFFEGKAEQCRQMIAALELVKKGKPAIDVIVELMDG